MSTKILDHIPHLTPPGTLAESVGAFIRLGFTVTPGGTHAGGATANALVVFADGTYLELIHFVHPPPSDTDTAHPWGKKQPGWIDYAFLGNGRTGADSVATAINDRAKKDGTPLLYEEEGGGRRREDGKVLEWLISSTAEAADRGKLPFFCGDVTPREWRVPLDPPSNFEHANTAIGISYTKLLVHPDAFDLSAKQLSVVLGAEPSSSNPAECSWELDEQPGCAGVHKSGPRLVLAAAHGDEERVHLQEHGSGVYEVGFLVTDRSKAGSALTPYGRLVWNGETV
ncbi:glyoxalase-like domain-containing protein [Daedaleopsis nitida]|nr:glyoxalase-like domain-containing protein [Daedaleopsis nitida]